MLQRVVFASALPPQGEVQRVGIDEMLGRRGKVAPRVQHVGQAVLEQHPLPALQVAFGEQAALRREVVVRQLSAQQLGEMEMGRGAVAIELQCGAEGFRRSVEVARLQQRGAKVDVPP